MARSCPLCSPVPCEFRTPAPQAFLPWSFTVSTVISRPKYRFPEAGQLIAEAKQASDVVRCQEVWVDTFRAFALLAGNISLQLSLLQHNRGLGRGDRLLAEESIADLNGMSEEMDARAKDIHSSVLSRIVTAEPEDCALDSDAGGTVDIFRDCWSSPFSIERRPLTCKLARLFARLICLTKNFQHAPWFLDLHSPLFEGLGNHLTRFWNPRHGNHTPASLVEYELVDVELELVEMQLPVLPVQLSGRQLLTGNGSVFLDILFSVFVHLRSHDALECPIVILLSSLPAEDTRLLTEDMISAINGAAIVMWDESVHGPDGLIPQSLVKADSSTSIVVSENQRRFLDQSMTPNYLYKSDRRAPVLRSYIDRILNRFHLHNLAAEPLLVTLILREHKQRNIRNHREVSRFLRGQGYVVEAVHLTNMTFREQTLQFRPSEMVVTSFHDTLAGVFMHPGYTIQILWPNPDARMFWPERYCPLHVSIVPLGVRIQSVDKPFYDYQDTYLSLEFPIDPGEVIRVGSTLQLNRTKYPTPASILKCSAPQYDLMHTDFTVEIEQLIELNIFPLASTRNTKEGLNEGFCSFVGCSAWESSSPGLAGGGSTNRRSLSEIFTFLDYPDSVWSIKREMFLRQMDQQQEHFDFHQF